MNLSDVIVLKERIAISPEFTPAERDFILDSINAAIGVESRKVIVEKHETRNYLGRIDHLWAALSLDDGGEGLCAAPMGAMTMPLIAADKHRLDLIRPLAQSVARAFAKPVRIVMFNRGEDAEIYQP